MQLFRVIAEGVDVDGDRSRDLDPDRIGIEGASFSGGLGIVMLAVDDRINVGALCVPGGASGKSICCVFARRAAVRSAVQLSPLASHRLSTRMG